MYTTMVNPGSVTDKPETETGTCESGTSTSICRLIAMCGRATGGDLPLTKHGNEVSVGKFQCTSFVLCILENGNPTRKGSSFASPAKTSQCLTARWCDRGWQAWLELEAKEWSAYSWPIRLLRAPKQ